MALKRKQIDFSDKYRIQLGKKLKNKRLEKGYSQKQISIMTEIPRDTVKNIENGSTKGLDYYLEYSKALEYELTDLFNIEIVLKPKHELSSEEKKVVRFTQLIRHNLLLKGFFKEEKSVEQVSLKLFQLELINTTVGQSQAISGVLRNMIEDDHLKVSRQDGNGKINYYIEK